MTARTDAEIGSIAGSESKAVRGYVSFPVETTESLPRPIMRRCTASALLPPCLDMHLHFVQASQGLTLRYVASGPQG
jgi:hypothetical protein